MTPKPTEVPAAAPAAAPTPPANALQRGLLVLRCFSANNGALGSSDLMRMTGLPQPTVWRICKTLEAEGFLVSDPATRRYRPGVAVLQLGYAALAGSDMNTLTQPYLEALAARVGGSAALAIPQGNGMLFTQRCEASGAIVLLRLRVGEILDIATTANGWAWLAAIGPAARQAWIEALPASERTAFEAMQPAFQQACAQWERTGYMVNVDVFLPGLTSLAVAFQVKSTGQWYVVSCTAMTPAITSPALRDAAGSELLTIAARFSVPD